VVDLALIGFLGFFLIIARSDTDCCRFKAYQAGQTLERYKFLFYGVVADRWVETE
jgi:hypothetical protein